jgi:hypothetical protein
MDEELNRGDVESIGKKSLSITSIESPRAERSEPGPKIFFAPHPIDKHRELTSLPLTRTFSRNSYSSAKDEEDLRVRRATRSKVEPQTILPIGMGSCY